MPYTFKQFEEEAPAGMDGPRRKRRFERLPERLQEQAWCALRDRGTRERARREPTSRTDWRGVNDRLRQIEACEYVERISAHEVPEGHRVNCPLPDHDDHSRDFGVKEVLWHCFGCERGGTIYEFAAHYWGRGLRGEEFKALQRELADLFGLL